MKTGSPHGWAACILLALASCGGGDEEKAQGALGAFTATTDLEDRVLLAWTIDGPSPDVVGIERDGERIATLRGSARSFEDRGAAPGAIAPPTLRAEGSKDAVHLEWDPPGAGAGATHTYEVVLEVDGSATGRAAATGSRAAPRPAGYAIVRDDVTIARVGWRTSSFDDLGAEGGSLGAPMRPTIEETPAALVLGWSAGGVSPGSAHAYRVIALGPGGEEVPSAEMPAGRTAPELRGFVVYRDGALVERLDASVLAFADDGASPGRVIAGSLDIESRVDAVVVTWKPRASPGADHVYVVRAFWDEGEGPDSPPISGRRPAPSLQGWRLLRDGIEIADLGADERSWEDFEAEPAVVGTPRNVVATRGTREDGVEVTWDSGSEVVPHLYELVADTEIGAGDAVAEMGARALPPLRYEVRRDDGDWIDLGDVTSWLDEEAPKAIIRPMAAVSVSDRYRGFADLRLAAPISFEPESAPIYEVRTVTEELETDAAMAPGYRGFVDLSYQWKRGFGDDPGTYVDVPGATEIDSFDLAPPLDIALSWILEVQTGGRNLAFSAASPPAMVPGFNDVSASWGFACGVRSFDKNAVCWSPGHQQPAILPRPPSQERFQYVRTGNLHACGLAQDGAIVCWGDVSAGASPSQQHEYESLTAGYDHNCAIRVTDWTALCWGADDFGQTRVPGGVNFKSLSAGYGHTCGIRSDGKVICWGDDSHGAAPRGPTADAFLSISAGGHFTCGIRTGDRAVSCWGSNEGGVVSGVPSGAYDAVTAGKEHACALRSSDRTMVCWGTNSVGQARSVTGDKPMRMASAGNLLTCGIGMADRRVSCWGAASPPPAREKLSAIAAGRDLACAIRQDDGSVSCWGSDSNERIPREPTAGSYVSLSVGAESACAIRMVDRAAECWGGKSDGELTPPASPSGYASVAAGDGFACGIRRGDGKVVCWGPTRPPAAPSTPTDHAFAAIAAGHSFACGLLQADGSITCWSSEASVVDWPPGPFEGLSASASGDVLCATRKGRLASCWMDGGLGPDPRWFFPLPLASISVGADHACGLDDDGEVFCAGADGKGQLGEGVIDGLRLESVSAGKGFTCGIRKENGRRICWGDNWYGQAPVSAAIP